MRPAPSIHARKIGSYEDGEQEVDMQLSGIADFAKTPFPVGPGEKLEGWQVTWRDPADNAAREYPAMRTLEELRELLEEIK